MQRRILLVSGVLFMLGSIQGWLSAVLVFRKPGPKPLATQVVEDTKLVKWGLPRVPSFKGEGFYLEFDGRFGIPRFVLECLTQDNLNSQVSRDLVGFRVNSEMPKEFWVYPKYYNETGYDRGHMASAANHQYSLEALKSVSSMANIAPQVPNLNRGVWASLEKKVRDKIFNGSTVWVVSGPLWLLGNDGKTVINWIGQGQVAVPTHFFKTYLVQTQNNTLESGSWVIANSSQASEVWVSTDTLETWTGVDFWPELPASQQESLESGKGVKIVLGK